MPGTTTGNSPACIPRVPGDQEGMGPLTGYQECRWATARYNTWKDISRGLMSDTLGPVIEETLRWDTAAAFTVTMDTPWDILRAQLLWAIWCQRVAVAFRDENFHLGVVLWQAWKNTIYCAIEAYKELFRHARNEEKRQELISCFQTVWTQSEIFGRMRGGDLKWNLTPHKDFLPEELGAWNVQPIRIQRLSPSPDLEAEFTAREDFGDLIDAFIRGVGNNQDLKSKSTQELDTSSQDTQGWTTPTPIDVGETDTTYPTSETPTTTPLETGEQTPPPSPQKRNPLEQLPSCQQNTHNQNRNVQKRKASKMQGKENCPPAQPKQMYTPFDAGTSKSSRPKRKCFRRRPLHRATSLSPLIVQGTNCLTLSEQMGTVCGQEAFKTQVKSRPKKRCCFGPRKRGDNDGPPSLIGQETPHNDVRGHTLSHSRDQDNPIRSSHTEETRQHDEGLITSAATLAPPIQRKRTPFDRYRGITHKEPELDPYRFVHQRLGVSASEFKDKINDEIDDLFQEIERERRQSLLETLPFEKALSKEDCLRIFSSPNTPQTGSVLGILRWASENSTDGEASALVSSLPRTARET